MPRREWASIAIVAVATGFFAWQSLANGERVFPIILVLCLGGLVWWSWPGKLKGPHVSNRQATAEAREGGAIIYWRPG